MSLEVWHQEEIRARRELEKLDPDNDALKLIYHSTKVACEAYWDAMKKLQRLATNVRDEKNE